MARVIVELCEDIRFEDGSWVPSDERTAALVDGLVGSCATPRRLFSRAAAALDIEHIALCDAARRAGEKGVVPDLNLYYVVDGDVQALALLPLVRAAVEVAPLPAPAAMAASGGALLPPPGDDLLADAIDRAAALLGAGDTLVVPYPLVDPGSRAAAVVAARRGVRVLTPEGKIDGGKAVARRSPRARVSVVLEAVTLVAGGDRGHSELYIEGWVDDGERRPFRVPEKGARTGVLRGAVLRFDAALYEGIPLRDALTVHVEVWEEDLGRTSLVDPDDLIGVHERRFTADERWGEGRHDDVGVATEEGQAVLSYVIRQMAC